MQIAKCTKDSATYSPEFASHLGHTSKAAAQKSRCDNLQFSFFNLRIVKSFSPNFQPKVAVSRQIRLRHRATIQLDRLRRLSSREERRGHRASRESRLVPG